MMSGQTPSGGTFRPGTPDPETSDPVAFDTVLVANRGEIAARIIRTLRALGIKAVAVYSDADEGAYHLDRADQAVRLERGYLDIDGVIDAALATGAQAVHPGYGFLAENPAFARACERAGLVFVGPPAEAIEAMGDKIRAKETVAAAGVPVVPGTTDLAQAAQVGFPLLIKPSAGGGGKGMLRVDDPAGLAEALASARRTAAAAFGDDTLLVERFVENPRHIEFQVMADRHGNVIHLGERECSLQRRHQKIVEEAPSPLLDEATRERMGAAAVEAARSCGYVGAGTVEFIVGDGEFYFMEMNTRLQVEHPVTEKITNLDLVELQIRVAEGHPLPMTQGQVRLSGHAVEARVYAEDPVRGFLPTGGTVLRYREPLMFGVRFDSGIAEGSVVGSSYDPMLCKVIARGADREQALRLLSAALSQLTLLGVTTNVGFLRELLAHPDVLAGNLDTGLVERHLDELVSTREVPHEVLAAAALERDLSRVGGTDPWDIADGWRIGERAWNTMRIGDAEVRTRAGEVAIDGGEPVAASLTADSAGRLKLVYAGVGHTYAWAKDGDVVWLGREGDTWVLKETERLDAARHRDGSGGDGVVRSPMPGTVLVVKAAVGDAVTAGQALIVVEAMKMEHTVSAPVDGKVTELPVRVGQRVDMDAILMVVEP
ncbi:acetyl/propionyl/methylcrotonyl-CoA carboxylase subunit alpha [Rhizohabitans arisaemae]|uniref:acetyl/propionyl/methylcrotonyl-CoA carboxylase subunit alpha n=1 Tax=Rhizohabitans arisaemae TaxID=2720610 RepID=UPI0024B160F3|nr:biotin carboxylase N-terminal domain-containing protein [Rhizohabitans arisaemae]